MDDNAALWRDLTDFYRLNKSRIRKNLYLGPSESHAQERIFNFCVNSKGFLVQENLCKLALIFSNTLGKKLPGHIHARIIFGQNNKWVKEYVDYTSSLKPSFWGFNINKNNFKKHTLGPDGQIAKLAFK